MATPSVSSRRHEVAEGSSVRVPNPGEGRSIVQQFRDVDLLRFSTAGSVDDGKSTLIGRLLYDTKSIFQDQLEAIEAASRRRGDEGVNLALLTDGLRAEREQNITIDVAYRYFATPKRKFIIADTPGHVQYTRNMVTGASTAELTIVLVDARKGVLTQSKRHGFIASLLRIPHVVVAVNKMDLVEYSQQVFERIVADYAGFASRLEVEDLVFIPISALQGDNIVHHSAAMPWYEGTTLLHHLETVNVGAQRNLIDFRLPVQYVIRPHQDFRGFAGRLASGRVAVGDEVVVLPSGHGAVVASVHTAVGEPVAPAGDADAERVDAIEGDSAVITLDREVDVSRGDMLVRKMNLPTISNRLDAIVCWMNQTPMDANTHYVLMHTTRQVKAFVDRTLYRIDVDTLHREDAATLGLNEIGRVEITTAQPLFFDAYQRNRVTGSFILIDPFTNVTVGAGMIRGPVQTADTVFGDAAAEPTTVSPNVVWADWNIPRAEREARQGHEAAVLWFTGLSGSGKSTIARQVEGTLFERGIKTMLLDGDQLRHGLCGDLGFSAEDRQENIRRAAEVARLFFESGAVVLCTFVSPFERDRVFARGLIEPGRFFEIHVDADVETCATRDPKGLYAKAAAGEIRDFTGVSSPYEAPRAPELVIDTRALSPDAATAAVLKVLERLLRV